MLPDSTLGALVHEGVARTVYRAAQHAKRRVRRSQRQVYEAYRAGFLFRSAAERWSHDRIREWQLIRLREVVRHAYATTEFYRERLDAIGFDPREDFDFADYARIPVLERETVRESGQALLSSSVPADQRLEDSTGGSTGTPTRLWKGPVERGWAEGGAEYYMRRIGLPPGSRTAFLWGHHLDPVTRATWRDRLYDHVHAARWYDCFRLEREVLMRYHHDLERWKPRGMIAYASALAALAEVVESLDGEPTYPRGAFVTGAEKLHAHQREVIERAFGRPVHERYGSRDAGLMGFQLSPRETLDFTVDWSSVLVEPDAPVDGADGGGGVAGVLVTKLRADAMPMLRYRVGDLARFPTGARPGAPSLVLHEVVGRDMDRVWLPDGRWMHPAVVPHMMKDFPVQDFQLHQAADYSVVVRITTADGYGDEAGTAILETLRANLPGVPVSLSIEAEIPRTRANKWRPVSSDVATPPVSIPDS